MWYLQHLQVNRVCISGIFVDLLGQLGKINAYYAKDGFIFFITNFGFNTGPGN